MTVTEKEYETYGAGFFGVLKDSKVTGLNIYGQE